MQHYRVSGADRQTAKERHITVTAEGPEDARSIALGRDLLVSHIQPAHREQVLAERRPSMLRAELVLFMLLFLGCIVTLGGLVPMLLLWWLDYHCTVLTITHERSKLCRGVLSKTTNEVWHCDVRNVRISQSLLNRMIGGGHLGISSAGQGGFEIGVGGIVNPNQVKQLIDQQRRGL